eukprot:5946843-Prymnesium_polylepis.2
MRRRRAYRADRDPCQSGVAEALPRGTIASIYTPFTFLNIRTLFASNFASKASASPRSVCCSFFIVASARTSFAKSTADRRDQSSGVAGTNRVPCTAPRFTFCKIAPWRFEGVPVLPPAPK